MVVNDHEYSKHYYIEGQRICSKLGGGMQNNLIDIHDQIVGTIYSDFDQLSITSAEKMQRDIECVGPLGYVEVNQAPFVEFVNGLPDVDNPETDLYFYHSDHLGSSSFITDANGISTQHLQYLPYGELFVEQRDNSNYYSPYKFSAKEKDEETSYSYFGARYLASDFSFWLSVDPMADKYPNISPYAYCAWNPVILVDPDGRDWFVGSETHTWRDSKAKQIEIDGVKYKNIGANYSQKNKDGTFTNFFQNVGFKSNTKFNAKDHIISSGQTGKYASKSSKLSEDGKKDLFISSVASRGMIQPDLIGVQFSGNAILGGGITCDITIGIVKGEGAFANASLGAGVGLDISAGVGIITGSYYGEGNPTSDKFTGGSLFQSAGFAAFNVTTSQDIDKKYPQPIGNNWLTTTSGISFGSSLLGSGSSGVSITTKPWRNRR
jgi:RHS repeat-associated protein